MSEPKRTLTIRDIRPHGHMTGDEDVESGVLRSWYSRSDGRTTFCPGDGAWYTHVDGLCGPCYDESKKQ